MNIETTVKKLVEDKIVTFEKMAPGDIGIVVKAGDHRLWNHVVMRTLVPGRLEITDLTGYTEYDVYTESYPDVKVRLLSPGDSVTIKVKD